VKNESFPLCESALQTAAGSFSRGEITRTWNFTFTTV